MNSNQEPSLQKGQKQMRPALTEQSELFPEDSADLSRRDSQTTPSTKQQACLSQALGQEISAVHSSRTLLEVLKMCSPADVLRTLSFVDRQWMEICSSNEKSIELWNTFLEDLYIPHDSSIHPKANCAAYLRQQQTVVFLHDNRMRVLNKARGNWKLTRLSETLPVGSSSYTVLFDGSLMYIGGIQIYRITVDGQVSSLEPMITERYGYGIVAYGRKVFVFGGYGIQTNEVYEASSWSEIPTKLNRDHNKFVPCIFKRLIYLFGNPEILEIFNPETLTIEMLVEVKIPNVDYNAITFYEGNVVAIGKESVYKWNLGRNQLVKVSKPIYGVTGNAMRTVLHGDDLYLINDDYQLMVDMKTFRRMHFTNLPF